jgi:hypothetical protein
MFSVNAFTHRDFTDARCRTLLEQRSRQSLGGRAAASKHKAGGSRSPRCKLAIFAVGGGRWGGLSHQALLRCRDVLLHPVVRPVIGNHGHAKPQRLVTPLCSRVAVGVDPIGGWGNLESVLPKEPLVDLDLPLVSRVPFLVEGRSWLLCLGFYPGPTLSLSPEDPDALTIVGEFSKVVMRF